MRAWSELLDRHPRVVTALLVAALLAALLGATRLRFEDDFRALFRSDDPSIPALEAHYARFGESDADVVILARGDDLLGRDARAVLRGLAADLRALPDVAGVATLDDVLDGPLAPDPRDEPAAARRARALAHPLVRGVLLSDDARTEAIVVRLRGRAAGASDIGFKLDAIRDLVARVRATSGLELRTTGVPVVRADVFNSLGHEHLIFMGLGALAGAVVFLAIFRDAASVAIGVAGALVGPILLLGGAGWVGAPITPINSVVPTIVLVVGFTDAVHLVAHVRTRLAHGASRAAAAREAIREVGAACFLTSLTTAIGFASLCIGRLEALRDFGTLAAAGCVAGFAGVLTAVPLLCRLAFAERMRHPSRRALPHANRLGRIAVLLVRRARVAAALALALAALFAWGAAGLRPDSFLREALPRDAESAIAIGIADAELHGVLELAVEVTWPEGLALDDPAIGRAIAAAESALRVDPAIGPPVSIRGVLGALPVAGARTAGEGEPWDRAPALALLPPEMVAPLLRADLRTANVVARLPDIGSQASGPLLDEVETALDAARAAQPGFAFLLTGNPVAIGRSIERMIGDLLRSLVLAGAIILVVMTIAFRSVRLGLVSVVPNALPLLACAAAIVWLGAPLTVTRTIAFCVSLGIAVDDTIHFVSRYGRALAAGRPAPVAIVDAMRDVGFVLVATTLVLVAGMSAVMTSDLPILRDFALLVAAALAAALLGDLLALPALLAATATRRRQVEKSTASSAGRVR